MIRLENVSKVFKTSDSQVRALDDVSLSIEAGRFVAVRGPSGCGKSTLLTVIGGLAAPTSGKVFVADQEVSSMGALARANFRASTIGFVFQMFHLLPYLTVLENVLVAALPRQAQQANQRALALLEKFQLAERLKHRPAELSTGERQRVAVARALLNQPKLILADEPTGNLDPENATGVMDLLAGFQREGGTVLLVTHEEAAAACAQQTLWMRRGKLMNAQNEH